jgi:hypothetical protein
VAEPSKGRNIPLPIGELVREEKKAEAACTQREERNGKRQDERRKKAKTRKGNKDRPWKGFE